MCVQLELKLKCHWQCLGLGRACQWEVLLVASERIHDMSNELETNLELELLVDTLADSQCTPDPPPPAVGTTSSFKSTSSSGDV